MLRIKRAHCGEHRVVKQGVRQVTFQKESKSAWSPGPESTLSPPFLSAWTLEMIAAGAAFSQFL